MVDLQWSIEGRRFRNAYEYKAALRDKELIDSITGNLNLDNPKDIEKLYMELKNGKYQFESIVGRQFDDNIYELYNNIREKERQKEKQNIEKKKKRVERFHKKEDATTEKKRFEDYDIHMQHEIIQVLNKKEKKRKLLMTVCALICLISFGYLGAYYQVSAKSEKEFEELAAMKEKKPIAGTQKLNVKRSENEIKDLSVLPEYENIYNKNKKLIGWVKIDDTLIDYPVMQTVNNEYYLDHNFNQEKDKNGCIFMDYQCDVVKGCDNIILYGHHMKSGKMFGGLSKYNSESYYNEHPTINFDTIYEKGIYQIMYVFRSKVYSEEEITFKYYQFINAASEKEFDSAMSEMAAMSLYDTGVTAAYGDQILTLSTCDYQESNGRFVVVAKKL